MGNRTWANGPTAVPRTTVRWPGWLVRGTLCVPAASPHALWWVAYLVRVLQGATLAQLEAAPPWPVPVDPLLVRHLLHELMDQRWVVPDWGRGTLTVPPHLGAAWKQDGEAGLAQLLFAVSTEPGEWWMDGLGGLLFPRSVAAQFDDDFREHGPVAQPRPPDDPQTLLDEEPELDDLVRKLGLLHLTDAAAEHRVFLRGRLQLGEPKNLLFQLYGAETRVLPDELAELEPVMRHHVPELLGCAPARGSRVVTWRRSPIEQFATRLERWPHHGTALDPGAAQEARDLQELLAREADWRAWHTQGTLLTPLIGQADQHFAALRELCQGHCALTDDPAPTAAEPPHRVLLLSSFLNERNLSADAGLAAVFREAPPTTRFLLVYGHANDDSPEQQQRAISAYLDRLHTLDRSLAERVLLVAARTRSHEKAVLTDRGDWLIGSFNPASAQPGTMLLECSLVGRDPAFGRQLLDHLAQNIEGDAARAFLAELQEQLERWQLPPDLAEADHDLARLRRSVQALQQVVDHPPVAQPTYARVLRAVRTGLVPFLRRTRVELIQQHQSRDVLLSQLRSARHDLLLASDRVSASSLDRTLLRDVQADSSQSRRLLRVLWGREWEGRRPGDPEQQEQLRRAHASLADARQQLGDWLRTSLTPMENHAKFLIVDGCRGLVTSENLLSYGGEKGQHESRELGLFFESLPVARQIQGRALLHRLEHLQAHPDAPPLTRLPYEWVVLGLECWHALAALGPELPFDPGEERYLAQALFEELGDTERGVTEFDRHLLRDRRKRFQRLARNLGPQPIATLRREGIRRYLLFPCPDERWRPYHASTPASALAQQVELALALHEEPSAAARPPNSLPPAPARRIDRPRTDPLIRRIMAQMVRLPAGTFLMGDDRVARERPRHRVTLTEECWLGRYPVTQALWQEVMGELPFLRGHERHPDFPIIQISFHAITRFLEALNRRAGRGGFALPTEAQWEYACRAGSTGDYCFGDDPALLERYAWTKRNSDGRLHPVGQLEPNRWGLYDLHGLVYESVCDDCRVFAAEPVTDPVGPQDGEYTGARGGAWGRFPLRRGDRAEEHFRCACRQRHPKTEQSSRASFRLLRSCAGPEEPDE